MLDLNYELDFIIGGSILKTSLKEHLEINNISPERTIEIEYILQNPKPEPEK